MKFSRLCPCSTSPLRPCYIGHARQWKKILSNQMLGVTTALKFHFCIEMSICRSHQTWIWTMTFVGGLAVFPYFSVVRIKQSSRGVCRYYYTLVNKLFSEICAHFVDGILKRWKCLLIPSRSLMKMPVKKNINYLTLLFPWSRNQYFHVCGVVILLLYSVKGLWDYHDARFRPQWRCDDDYLKLFKYLF